MLGIMRKYRKSIIIKIIFAIIVLSFIGTIFLIWGQGGKGIDAGDYALKVNGKKISYQEVQQSYDRIRKMFSNLTPEQENMLGLKKLAMDTLIDAMLMRQDAKRMGIKVTKAEMVAEIEKIPSFQRDGAFNFDQYQMVLRSARTTPEAFEESLKEDLLIRKARKKIEDQVKITDAEALEAYKKQHDKVNIAFVSFSPAELKGQVKASREDLDAYLQIHQAQFKTPEEVSISYVFIDPAKLLAKVSVSDEEILSYYQRNMDRYQGKSGILPFSEVKDRAKVDALKLKAVKQAYELGADAINKNIKTGNISTLAQSLGLQTNTTPLFTANNPPAALAGESDLIAKALTVQPNELKGPVETKKGIYIIALKERKPAAIPPLEKVRNVVEAGVVQEKATLLAKQKADEALVKLAKGETAGLKVQETGAFGYASTGDVPKIGKSAEIMENAFSLTTTAPTPKNPAQIGARWYAYRLKNKVEGDTSDFQRNKEQIKQQIFPRKQKQAVEEWLTELKKTAKIEKNPSLQID